jgi:hypothetical protein
LILLMASPRNGSCRAGHSFAVREPVTLDSFSKMPTSHTTPDDLDLGCQVVAGVPCPIAMTKTRPGPARYRQRRRGDLGSDDDGALPQVTTPIASVQSMQRRQGIRFTFGILRT